MPLETPRKQQGTITEWITDGPYAVAVEVEATFFAERPGEPFLSPESIRLLEQVARDARAGDVEAMRKAGRVFIQLEGTARHAPKA